MAVVELKFTPSAPKLRHLIMMEGILPKFGITQIPKADKDMTRKENYRSISLIDAKILNKILAK